MTPRIFTKFKTHLSHPPNQMYSEHWTTVYVGTHILMWKLLIPESRVLSEKLHGSQLFKKFPTFYGTQRFITATCPYPQPDQSCPCPPSHFLKKISCLFFHCLGCTKGSFKAWDTCILFVKRPVFMMGSCYHLTQPPSWRTILCQLSMTVYWIYSQLPSTLEAVLPSITWGHAVPWWQRSIIPYN